MVVRDVGSTIVGKPDIPARFPAFSGSEGD